MLRSFDRKGIGEVVHQYKNNGYNIVLDVNSGSVHVVDDVVYDLIRVVEELLGEECSAQHCSSQHCSEQSCGSQLCSGAWMEKIEGLHLPYAEEEIREALGEMSNVVLSIDGRKEVNDRMRPHRGGQGSYEEIVPKFQKLAESRKQMNYYVRGTFTRNNLDFSKDVEHLADLGFEQISVEPVVAEPSDDYALREEDLETLLAEYDRLAVELLERRKAGKPVNFFHFMIDLEGGPCVAKRLSGCGSGTEYLAVTPWGDLYPCHQFVGKEEFLMGNVEEGITRTDIRDEFKTCNVYAKEKCRDCFAKFYCSGGCAANSYNFHKNINDAYDLGCELQRKRIECAIMIKAALAE